MEYRIVEASCVSELTTRVQALLDEGWLPHGNLVASFTSNSTYGSSMLLQPMFRERSLSDIKL